MPPPHIFRAIDCDPRLPLALHFRCPFGCVNVNVRLQGGRVSTASKSLILNMWFGPLPVLSVHLVLHLACSVCIFVILQKPLV